MMMMMVVVVAIMMMIKMMIINNFLNSDERHEDGWKLCRFLLKICPKRPNFVGFFEEKIRTPPLLPPPPIRKPAILRRVRMRNGTFHRAIASSAKRLVLKYEPRSKRASKVDLLRADSFLGNLVPRVLSYPPPGARETDPFLSRALQRAGRREPWERGCFLGRLYLHTYFT